MRYTEELKIIEEILADPDTNFKEKAVIIHDRCRKDIFPRKERKGLESDCRILALRLCGEDESTFAPETREVMARWKPKVLGLASHNFLAIKKADNES